MNDSPVDLSALRTPPPLDERDYAAVRARVMGDIRHGKRAHWPWLLPLAAATLLMFVLVGRRPQDRPPLPLTPAQVATPPQVAAAAPKPTAALPTAASEPAVEEARPSPARVVSSRRAATEAPPMRIHMQTADPDVRIIWIVKEKS